MRNLLVVVALLLPLCAAPMARAEEPDLKEMERQIRQLEEIVEGLLRRIASLEAALAARGVQAPSAAPVAPGATQEPEAAAPGAQPKIEDDYDRFTGQRTVTVGSTRVQAHQKDDPKTTLPVDLRWVVRRDESGAQNQVLYVETTGDVRQWPQATPVYLLMDGMRSRTEVDGQVYERDRIYVEYVWLRFEGAGADAFGAANKVEMRVGAWELEVPKSFRSLAAEAVARARGSDGKR